MKIGAKPGDNAGSLFYRCKLNFSSKSETSKDLAVVIKSVPEIDGLENAIYVPVFHTEMKMYGETLPEFSEIWKSANDHSITIPK